MHTGIERRENERIEHKSTLMHSTNPPDFFYRGIMQNYSDGGLYFESNEDLIQGDVISISIQNPPRRFNKKSQEYFNIRIMWCSVLQSSTYQVGYGAKIIS